MKLKNYQKKLENLTRILLSTSALLLFISCQSSSKLPRPIIKPEIPISRLNENAIATISPNYKDSYFRLLPYLFFNANGTFNEIQGDFYNVKFNTSSNINIMPGFWRDYGDYKNSIIVLIALSETSSIPIKDIYISVESSKNGVFIREKINEGHKLDYISRSQQRVLFFKELSLENQYDVLNKINDDVLTVKVGEQVYKFLTPELELN
ncbi:hypothetical protein ACFSQJ_00250 [Croceitalea marina]|uniref:Lipoprotein n=1 Tax=Croceitalea marina TaxID=1775166 RepID=A0ABW5MQ50_9FLAO